MISSFSTTSSNFWVVTKNFRFNFNLFPLHDNDVEDDNDDGKGSSNLISDAAILFAELLVVLLATLSHNYANTLGKIHFIIAPRVAYFSPLYSSLLLLDVLVRSSSWSVLLYYCRVVIIFIMSLLLSTSSSLCFFFLQNFFFTVLISILFRRALHNSSPILSRSPFMLLLFCVQYSCSLPASAGLNSFIFLCLVPILDYRDGWEKSSPFGDIKL